MSIDRYIESLRLDDATTLGSNTFQLAGQPQSLRSSGSQPTSPATPAAPISADLQAAVGVGSVLSTAAAPLAASISADLQAAVDVGSVLSFVDGVSAQERDDILFSVQLAQRAASGAFDRYTQTRPWYQKYLEILERLGWTAEQLAFAQYDQREGELRMDRAALAVISAIATQNQLAVLQEAVQALAALAEGDGTIRLFDLHASAGASGNFQIGAVQKSANEALSMALGAFFYRSTDARRRCLFFGWGAQQVEFWTAAQKMTLNTTFYAQHRDAVRRKLGESALDFISALPLDRI